MTQTDFCKDLLTSYMTMPVQEQARLLTLFRRWQTVKGWVGTADFYVTAACTPILVTLIILTLREIGA